MVLRAPLVFSMVLQEHLVLAHGFVFAHGIHPWFHEAPYLYKEAPLHLYLLENNEKKLVLPCKSYCVVLFILRVYSRVVYWKILCFSKYL
jgi:hypothetical protein